MFVGSRVQVFVSRAFEVMEEAVRIAVAQTEQRRDLVEGPLRYPVNAMSPCQKSGTVANLGAENNRNDTRASNRNRAAVACKGALYGGQDSAIDLTRLVLAATVSAATFFGCASAADAADIGSALTKATLATQASPPPATCTSILDFFLTACQLSWYGVRFYGTIDVGFGYQTHGAPFDPNFVTC
jgi:hypothetical protein